MYRIYTTHLSMLWYPCEVRVFLLSCLTLLFYLPCDSCVFISGLTPFVLPSLLWCARCLKVMLVGDSGVGKTCLLVRFKDNAFLCGSFISTVGIDFRVGILVVMATTTPRVQCCCWSQKHSMAARYWRRVIYHEAYCDKARFLWRGMIYVILYNYDKPTLLLHNIT